MQIEFYDPHDIDGNTRRAIVSQSPFRLQRLARQNAGGIYVLYYTGPHPRYTEISSPDAKVPIYIGSAVNIPARLNEHIRSLTEVPSLEPSDFLCRCLHVPRTMEEMVEKRYIRLTGEKWWNHPDYSGFGTKNTYRKGNKATRWDNIHPGRKRYNGWNRSEEAEAAIEASKALAEEVTIFDLFGGS